MDNRAGRNAMFVSVAILHIWGFLLVLAAKDGQANSIIAQMFDAVCFGIFLNLLVLAGYTNILDFVARRFGVNVTEEVVKTTTVAKPTESEPVNIDVPIKQTQP